MNNYAVKPVSRPVKVNVVRIENMFHTSNPYNSFSKPIIKNYVYIDNKRIIA